MIHDYILSHFFVLHPHEDTIAAAAETNDELTAYVEKILDSIAEIEDEKKVLGSPVKHDVTLAAFP